MHIFNTVGIIITAFLLLNEIISVEVKAIDYDYYEDEPVYPHQEHLLCGSRHCENTCESPNAMNGSCPFRLCHEGYFCESGYVREFETDQCILPGDCPRSKNS